MSDAPAGADDRRGGGLLASLRRWGTTLFAILQTRLELVAAEYEEERAWVHASLVATAMVIFFLSIGVLLLTLFVILLFWDEHRLLAIGVTGLLYLLAAAAVWVAMRVRARKRPRFLSATLAELAKDRDALRLRS